MAQNARRLRRPFHAIPPQHVLQDLVDKPQLERSLGIAPAIALGHIVELALRARPPLGKQLIEHATQLGGMVRHDLDIGLLSHAAAAHKLVDEYITWAYAMRCEPAAKITEAMDATIPVAIVLTGQLRCCITSTSASPAYTEPPGLEMTSVMGASASSCSSTSMLLMRLMQLSCETGSSNTNTRLLKSSSVKLVALMDPSDSLRTTRGSGYCIGFS